MEEFNWELVNTWREEAEKIVSDAKRSAAAGRMYDGSRWSMLATDDARLFAALDCMQSRLAAMSEWRPAIERLGTPREVQNLEAALDKVLDKLSEARKERDGALVEAARLRGLLEAADACAPVARNPDVL